MSWAIEAAAMVVVRERSVLLVEENEDREEVGKRKGMLSFPMGKLKKGEGPKAAAQREFKEETGTEALVDYPLGFYQIEMSGGRRAGVWVFKGRLADTYAAVHERCRWLTGEEFLCLDPFSLRPLVSEIYQMLTLAMFVEETYGLPHVKYLMIDSMPESARCKLFDAPS